MQLTFEYSYFEYKKPTIYYLGRQKDRMSEKVFKICNDKNGKWLSGEYKGVLSKGRFKCSCGYEWTAKFGLILDNRWCPKCAKEYNAKCTKTAALFRNLNKEIQYYHSRQNVFDDINKEIKERKKEIKKSEAWLDKKRKESNEKYRDKARESFAYKYKNVPEFRLNELIKAQIKKCMVKGNSMGKYYKILGYTTKELYTHLESKFTDGMSWDNMGEWHIDHITPKSWFKLTKDDGTLDKEQFKKCWSLDNLQPLWGSDNIKKGNRYAG